MEETMKDFVGIGIDPSFSCTGLALLNQDEKIGNSFLISRVTTTESQRRKKDFFSIYRLSFQIALDVKKWIDEGVAKFPNKPVKIIMEVPPPYLQYSAGLYMLDGLITYSLLKKNYDIVFASSSKIKSLIGSKEKGKKIHTELAKDILFLNPGTTLHRGKEVNLCVNSHKRTPLVNDEADAFLLLALLMDLNIPDHIDKNKWVI